MTPREEHRGCILEVRGPLLVNASFILRLPTEAALTLPGLGHERLEELPCHPFRRKYLCLGGRLLDAGVEIRGEVFRADGAVAVVMCKLRCDVVGRMGEG